MDFDEPYWPSDLERGAVDSAEIDDILRLHPASREVYDKGRQIFLQAAFKGDSMPTVTRQRPINAKGPKPLPPKNRQPPGKTKRPAATKPLPKSFVFTQHYVDGLNARGATTIVCYGPSGVGKSSIWSFLPNVGFIHDPKDEGIVDLTSFGQTPSPKWVEEAKDFEHTLELLAEVANQEHDITHLVIDSLTGFELFCFQYHCRENFENDWSNKGFYSYMQGPKNAAKTDWPRFLDAMDDVRRSGISVVAIAHSQVKTFNNPDGDNYDQHRPYLDNETWQQTHRWAKAVLFYNLEVGLTKKGARTKAVAGSESRMLYCDIGATFIAKNRWGINAVIDAGGSAEEAYNNFMSSYMEAGNG